MAIRGLRVFALIPARGGSKGIPRKNLKTIGGKSLVEIAGSVALSVSCIDRVVLSSEDAEIAAVARAAGIDVPFLRPLDLASDTAKSIDVWRHAWLAIEAEEGEKYDLGVLLEPTSPLRRASDIQMTIERLLDTGAKAATTVSPTPGPFTPHKTLQIDADDRVKFFLPDGARFSRRQDIPSFFHRNGVCYVARRKTIVEDGTIVEADCAPVVMNRPLANIDDPIDLEFAEFLIARERRHNEP